MRGLWLHRYAQVTVAAAFFVIFAGAMVTSTGSGMAVPDWPTSFGSWMPPMVGGVFYEHGHRIVAFTAGLLTTVLALWTQFVEPRAMVRRLAWYAFLGILAQGLLGGIAVMLGTSHGWDHTSPVFATAHACLAQALFAVLVCVAVTTAPGWKTIQKLSPEKKDWRFMSVVTVTVVYVQIILGAVMRHENAGLIIPDFPLSYGKLVPYFAEWRVGINYAHRVGALTVLILALTLSIGVLRSSRERWIKVPAAFLLFAVLLQVSLGACVVWSGLQPVITSAHVLGGALVLTSSLVLALRLFKAKGLASV